MQEIVQKKKKKREGGMGGRAYDCWQQILIWVWQMRGVIHGNLVPK